MAPACFATGLWNLVDFPAGIVPVGRVTEADADAMAASAPKSLLASPLRHMMHAANADSVGLPTSVQVVTLPYQEEMCLKVMRIVESCLAGNSGK